MTVCLDASVLVRPYVDGEGLAQRRASPRTVLAVLADIGEADLVVGRHRLYRALGRRVP